MATTDHGSPAPSAAGLRTESSEPVLALLAEISRSLKDLNMALKDTRLLKQDDAYPQDCARSMDPENQTKFPWKDTTSVTVTKVKYGYFPEQTLCYQLFGDIPLREDDQCSPWLKERRLVFPRDERTSFRFDAVSLGMEEPDNIAAKVETLEKFARDLREKGGFFFFRESYVREREGQNKIYSGTHVFRCNDGMDEALPRLSANRKNFCEDLEEDDDGSLRRVLEARAKSTESFESPVSERMKRFLADYYVDGDSDSDSDGNSDSENHLEPSISYYTGELYEAFRRAPDYLVGGHDHDSGVRYHDPHFTAEWRRLCVLTGLSRIPDLDESNIHAKLPLFCGETMQGRYDSEIVSNETNGDYGTDFYERSILEHLDCTQLAIFRRFRRRVCIKFQFSWYELIPDGHSERRRYSGRLYRDDDNRSLQLQSFMAIATWQVLDESLQERSGDCEFWTLVIMAPAFFYHRDERDNSRKELIAPLADILPTLSATLSELMPRVLEHWTGISKYIEQFIAGQDTFLDEHEHDQLLFDDDNFTRSRQYFWVITSIGEFIPIIDETISHYEKVSEWVSREKDERRIHAEFLRKLEAIKERFERQRSRATILRDGLFNASAVFESRLSTRLSQNVKLLTYVSIFYLPLAFCAALWAIPNITDSSTRTPFIVTTVFIGLATYFIVLNLDALASLSWTTYSGFRKRRIEQMMEDDYPWSEFAECYNRFEPDREDTKPSEWYILVYYLLRPFIMYEDSEDEGEEDDSVRYRRSSFVTPSIDTTETSRAESWKAWLEDCLREMKALLSEERKTLLSEEMPLDLGGAHLLQLP